MISKHKLLRLILSLTLLINFTVLGQKSAMAAPGDTMIIVNNQGFICNGAIYANNGKKAVLTIKNTSLNSAYSNIKLRDMHFRTSVGATTTLSGTITAQLRKNGVNGTIIYSNSLTNPHVSSGHIYLGFNNLTPNGIVLFPGESLDIVLEHNLAKEGYNPIWVDNYNWSYSPMTDYYLTDLLIQTGVSASTEARDAANAAHNNSWYTGTYGGPQESVSNVAGYIRMSQHYNKF